MPWSSPDDGIRYHDLRAHPEALALIPEAVEWPELGEFLRRLNAAGGALETVKCDAWGSTEIEPAEEIFGGRAKRGSYCDLIFRKQELRFSFEAHEEFVRRVAVLLRKGPELPASAELVVRHSHFHAGAEVRTGFAISAFVLGYGEDAAHARLQWSIALELVGNALKQGAQGWAQ